MSNSNTPDPILPYEQDPPWSVTPMAGPDSAHWTQSVEAQELVDDAYARLRTNRHRLSGAAAKRAEELVGEMSYCIPELAMVEVSPGLLQELLVEREAAREEFEALLKKVESA